MGHIISKEEISIDVEKIRAITECIYPNNVDEMRSFIGLGGYIRRFITKFSQVSYHITSLRKKGKNFEWIEECEAIFEKLKQLLTHAQMLKIADSDKEFVVCTNSCKKGLGGVLI